MSTICFANPSSVRHLADALSIGLRVELDLTPKPGLVDRWDSGSHDDLDYRLMIRIRSRCWSAISRTMR